VCAMIEERAWRKVACFCFSCDESNVALKQRLSERLWLLETTWSDQPVSHTRAKQGYRSTPASGKSRSRRLTQPLGASVDRRGASPVHIPGPRDYAAAVAIHGTLSVAGGCMNTFDFIIACTWSTTRSPTNGRNGRCRRRATGMAASFIAVVCGEVLDAFSAGKPTITGATALMGRRVTE
jgi:hypothetical protein